MGVGTRSPAREQGHQASKWDGHRRWLVAGEIRNRGFHLGPIPFILGGHKTGMLRATASAPVESPDDSGPLKDVGPVTYDYPSLASFAPGFEGAPTWSAVTYVNASGECFDVNAEWNGSVLGSIGGCGFGEDVDTLIRLLSVNQESADTGALIASADVTTPFTLADGYVASPDEKLVYGVVAGIVDCDCVVTARWKDGEVSSAKAVDGFFVIRRAPLSAAEPSDASGVASVAVAEEAAPD